MASPDTEIGRLLAALKHVYRVAGIHYADAAQTLDVSELTIKRWMAGKGLTLAALGRLCAVANITLAELISAGEASREKPIASSEQATTIATDVVSGMIFFLLTRDWTAQRIAQELRLDEATMNRHLTLLDRIGVIELFPGNRVRVLRRMSGNIRDELPTFKLVARRVHQFFDNPDLFDSGLAWSSGIARLSRSSFAQVSTLLDQLRDELFALGQRDLDLPQDEVAWYTFFAAARPVAIEALMYENPADAERARLRQ
jgi:transcriptional regulator with XRE-family HTH domain